MTTAANTPTQYYLSNSNVAGACKDNFKKIDKECGPKESREKAQHPVLNKLLGPANTQKLEAMAAKVKGDIPTTNDNRWMSHCDGLWIKPDSVKDATEFNQMLKGLSDDLNGSLQKIIQPMLNDLKTAAENQAESYAADQGKKALLREVGEEVVGLGPEDPFADIAVVIDRVCTWIKIATFAPQAMEQLKDLMSFKDLATKAAAEMKDLAGNVGNMTPTQLMATGMGVLARLNPCTRARRCLLVKYDDTNFPETLGGHGCCPGQSGHHILPDAMTKGGVCPGYAKGGAPTLCVEGANNGNGTHGQIHDVLALQMDIYKKNPLGGKTMDYDTARAKGVHSVMMTFPESKCNEKCLEEQLDAYYKTKCTNQLPAEAGKKFKENAGGNGK